MEDNKLVYINENYNSDEEEGILYGGNNLSNSSETLEEKIIDQSEIHKEPIKKSVEINEEPIEDTEEISEELNAEHNEELNEELNEEHNEEQFDINENGNNKEVNVDEEVNIDEEVNVDEEVNDDKLLLDHSFNGGGYVPKKLDDETATIISSVDTDNILSVDPLYFRLTKFLQTSQEEDGGEEPQNIADILKKINMNLDKMNTHLENYIKKV